LGPSGTARGGLATPAPMPQLTSLASHSRETEINVGDPASSAAHSLYWEDA
jgi:hypothetical protein